MKNFLSEVDENFKVFYEALPDFFSEAVRQINYKDDFRLSYQRVVSLQAWRSELVSTVMSPSAEGFFREAQNDALSSHMLARQGAWRVALMALRSCMENVLFALYYFQHPIELELWESGKHKLGFTEAIGYLAAHPWLHGFNDQQSGLDIIKKEYEMLSRAVHGSSISFRMTRNGLVDGLNKLSVEDFGAWRTREKQVIKSVNLLLLVFFRKHIGGASKSNLRKAISVVIPPEKHAEIQALYVVKLYSH